MAISLIKNTLLRRCAIVAVFPAVLVWKLPLALLWPFYATWSAFAAGVSAFRDEWLDHWNAPAELLLRRGMALLWSRDYHRDREAALAAVRKIGRRA